MSSDEGVTKLVEKKSKVVEVISLVTSEEEKAEGSTTDYDSDEEHWRQRKNNCSYILWECNKEVGVVNECFVFFWVFFSTE